MARRFAVPSALVLGPLLLALAPLPASAQAPCFRTVEAPPWMAADIGTVLWGSSRPLGSAAGFELCSASTGFGRTADSLRYLFQTTRADFEITARVERIAPAGLGGVMALWDGRTADEPYVRIAAHANVLGVIELRSSFRTDREGTASAGNSQPVPFGLPVTLRVRRQGHTYITSYSRDGTTFTEHLKVDGAGTGLAEFFFTAGMVQAGGEEKLPASAVFLGPRLESSERSRPPRITRVLPPNSPLEGGEKVIIEGSGLGAATEASLAGIPARIVDATDYLLTVEAGAAREPVAGDVLVTAPGGSAVLERGFTYLGRTFIRGDFNGSLRVDLSDAIAGLNFLFQGGPPALCPEVADTNSDGVHDLSDEVFLLIHLFVGTRPPAPPYPAPGIPSGPSSPCGLPAAPVVKSISHQTVKEGDIVTFLGSGFARDPARNVVLFGGSRAETLEASEDRLLVRVGSLAREAMVNPAILIDIDDLVPLFPTHCLTKKCGLDLSGIIAVLGDFRIRVLPDLKPLGTPAADPRAIVYEIDRRSWDPYETYEVRGSLFLPPVQGLSRGSRVLEFEYRRFTPEMTYGEWLDGLAERLQEMVGSEARVIADEQLSRLMILPDQKLGPFIAENRPWLDSLIDVVLRPPLGKCGPSDLDPLLNPREFGWCRFEELIANCGGLPRWEYFIPRQSVFQESSAIFPLPFPWELTTGQKRVLYNRPAYCHVRNEKLYFRCTLDGLIDEGKSQVPHFPRPAIVLKTGWTTEASILARGGDPSKYYKYTDSNGDEQYLELFHYTTKDIDKWFWATFWVPTPSDPGPPLFDCGAGGGADKPASIPAPWSNYSMCVNIEEDVPCGNPNFAGAECPLEPAERGCISCHEDASYGSLKLDFLFSADSGPPGDCD
jgi:hypothetical protein